MQPSLTISLIAGVLGGLSAVAYPCAAQAPPSLPSTQSQTAQSPAIGSQLPSMPSTTPAPTPSVTPTPNLGQGSRAEKLSPSVGRGLSGMSGGPPLNAPMGAQDRASGYMTPPVLGPLICDQDLNPACL